MVEGFVRRCQGKDVPKMACAWVHGECFGAFDGFLSGICKLSASKVFDKFLAPAWFTIFIWD